MSFTAHRSKNPCILLQCFNLHSLQYVPFPCFRYSLAKQIMFERLAWLERGKGLDRETVPLAACLPIERQPETIFNTRTDTILLLGLCGNNMLFCDFFPRVRRLVQQVCDGTLESRHYHAAAGSSKQNAYKCSDPFLCSIDRMICFDDSQYIRYGTQTLSFLFRFLLCSNTFR